MEPLAREVTNANPDQHPMRRFDSLAPSPFGAMEKHVVQKLDGQRDAAPINEINQYTSVGGASPSYNSRGDLSGINGWAFSYDAFGNLSSAQSGTNAAYHYARDPLGRRAIRQSGSNTIVLLNAGDTMLEAYNATGNSVSSYIYEPGIDRPLAQVLSNGSIRYVHQDVLGSVVMLTDSNGAPYQSYSYDAWGKVTARDAAGSVIASSAISAPWLFTGRRFDKESGLYHYRARTYSAELGRFLQMDPIKFDAGDPNIFRYVGNDPVNGTDPHGLFMEGTVGGVMGRAAVGAAAGAVAGSVFAGVGAGPGAIIGGVVGILLKTPATANAPSIDTIQNGPGKGERNWEKGRGDDWMWDLTPDELRDIERDPSSTPNEKERAKRIRKQKEKKRC